jgi:hypothetical protein
MEADYKSVLSNQKREMEIMLIREKHPVYRDFNFTAYSDHKVTEMYRILVGDIMGGKSTGVQTKV